MELSSGFLFLKITANKANDHHGLLPRRAFALDSKSILLSKAVISKK